MKNKLAIGGLLLATFLPAAAQAQDPGAPTITGETGLFSLRSGYTNDKGQWTFGVYYSEIPRRVTPDRAVQEVDPLWTDWDLEHKFLRASVGYAVSSRVELALSLPIHEDYQADPRFTSTNPNELMAGRLNGFLFRDRIDTDGIGNLRLAAKIQLREGDDWGLALTPFIDFPTGDDDKAIVTGDTGFGVGLAWSKRSWVANVAYWDPGDPDAGQKVGDQILVGLGYVHSFSDRFDWITELNGAIKTESVEHADTDLTSGGRWWFGGNRNWTFNAALRLDLSEGTSIWDDYSPLGFLIGLTYQTRPAPPPPPPPPVEPPPAPPVAPPPPPPPPPVVRPTPPIDAAPTTTFASCPQPTGKAKGQRWPCESSREVVYFETGKAQLSGEQQTKLCDLVSQLRYCTQMSACIAGRTAEGENPGQGQQRANVVDSFLKFQGVSGRYQIAPACPAPTAAGTWVDIYLEPKR